MAHELETFTNGQTAFASARLTAWHRLGTVVDHTMTAEQAMATATSAAGTSARSPCTAPRSPATA
jgi:hypothetical protein